MYEQYDEAQALGAPPSRRSADVLTRYVRSRAFRASCGDAHVERTRERPLRRFRDRIAGNRPMLAIGRSNDGRAGSDGSSSCVAGAGSGSRRPVMSRRHAARHDRESVAAAVRCVVTRSGPASTVDRATSSCKLGRESGWVSARTVRVERTASRPDRGRRSISVEPALRAVDRSGDRGSARRGARRPSSSIDDQMGRRADLIARLAARGMTPLAPRTPLEAIDLLTRSQLHVNVACSRRASVSAATICARCSLRASRG